MDSCCTMSESDTDSSSQDDNFDTEYYEKIEREVEIIDDSDNKSSHPAEILLQNKAALLISDLKENANTTQVAINRMIAGVNAMMPHYNDFVKNELLKRSQSGIIRVEDVINFFQFLDGQNIFEGVQTSYRQKWYEKEMWPEHLEFRKIILKWKTVMHKDKIVEVPKDFGYRVSFYHQLHILLQNDEVLKCIDHPKPSLQNKFTSILDGYIYQSHEVVKLDPHALAFILYVDDVACTDVLSSYQDHGIRNYSWTLANIYPELRSTLRTINLLALANAKVAKKYKNEPFLRDFIFWINKLSSKEGVTFKIKNVDRVFHGFLLIVIGDLPASGNIGGFKESASAKCPCRTCFVCLEDICNFLSEDDVVLRNQQLHKEQLQMMKEANDDNISLDQEERIIFSDSEDDLPQEKRPLCAQAAQLSTKFGINDESCLLKLTHFDCCRSMPHDIMHVFLEGILKSECHYILQDSIGPKKLSLAEVNFFLENYDYEQWKTDKPSPIETKHMKSGLRQNSSQVLMLSTLLPFVVQEHCDEKKLQNFVLLLMIFNLCLSHEIEVQDIDCLKKMIREYLEHFNILYPNKFVPKHHFLIHLPTQIYLFGPLTEQWAMRFEAFHSQMKRLTKVLHNAKNLVFSLMTRLLSKRSLELRQLGANFLSKDILVPNISSETTLDNLMFQECILQVTRGLQASSKLLVLKTLKFHGAKYEPGALLHILDKKNTLPTFGVVCEIYGLEGRYYVIYHEVITLRATKVLNAYQFMFSSSSCYSALIVPDSFLPRVLHVKRNSIDYAVIRGNPKPQYAGVL
ncbi:33 kDa chaperonin [Frankliniella fusca]|uniref:33 kDa chaperonin n=1 Tax=Frankliniella fusca TaxID=407009 RepID=A0AAE1LGY2_9NEOP|nr:33 kDa chaperonin [Frankliniella fusca]